MFYERAQPPLDTYFKLILVLLHLKPHRQSLIERELGVTAHTIFDWYSFCRGFYDHIVNDSAKLGRPLTVVEIEQAKLGKRQSGAVGLRGSGCLGGFKETQANASWFRLKLLRDAATLLAILKDSRFFISQGTHKITIFYRVSLS